MLAAEDYPGMCCDDFAAWAWLLPLNVSVLPNLTLCKPGLKGTKAVGLLCNNEYYSREEKMTLKGLI